MLELKELYRWEHAEPCSINKPFSILVKLNESLKSFGNETFMAKIIRDNFFSPYVIKDEGSLRLNK